MAKCIKYPNEVISRVSDEDAALIVAAGAGHYTSKTAWKAFLGKEGRDIVHKNALSSMRKNRVVLAEREVKRIKRRLARQEHRKEKYRHAAKPGEIRFRGAA